MKLFKKYNEFYEEISKKSSDLGAAIYVKSEKTNIQNPFKCDSVVRY